MQKLNDSLAKELISTQDGTKCAQMLDTKDKKKQISSQLSKKQFGASKRQSSKKLLQLLIKDQLLFDGTLGDWKTMPVSFQQRKRITRPGLSFPSAKNTQDILIIVDGFCKLGVLKRQQASKRGISIILCTKIKKKNLMLFSNF
jgi:hypothetical protein